MTTVSRLERVCLSVSDQFDALMRRRSITQLKLSLRSGRLHYSTVGRILKGRNFRLSTLVDLADGLDCDVEVKLVPRDPAQHPSATSGASH